MKVRFLQDFQGRETQERFYVKGQIVEFDPEQAAVLIRDNRAELVVEPYKAFVEPVRVEDEQPKKKVKK